MDMTALMPRTATADMTNLNPERSIFNSEKKKRLPCCKGKKKAEPWLDGTLNSEYRNQFIEKEVPNEMPKKAPGLVKNNARFDGLTTNKADYLPHQVAREQMVRPVHSQAVENLPFSGNSAYAADFGPKEVAYQRVKPTDKYEPNKGEFYGTTTYNGDFLEGQIPQAARRVMQPSSLRTGGAPFEGSSMYKDSYTKPLAVRREAIRPQSSDLPTGKFNGDTMYNSSYVPKEINLPEQFRPQDARPLSRSGWYGGAPSTEYGGQFFNKETPHVEPVKAARGGDLLGKGPFDGSTTNKADYTAYAAPMKDALIRPSNAIEADKLPFNGESTYTNQYVSKDVPYSRVKPQTAFVPNSAPFDGSTTNKANFKDYGMVPTYRGKARATSFGKDGRSPFEGTSTYKANFAKMPTVPRTKASVLASQPLRSGPFDGVTTYRKDFVEKEIPAREADCRECDSCEEDAY